MCGIVGFVGNRDAKEAVLNGLEKLEYRGYDSAGIALIKNEYKAIEIYKDKGRIKNLRNIIKTEEKQHKIDSHICIGHTRWATHGVANKINAHPHQCQSKRFTLVHNGIIENYEELETKYLAKFTLASDTDSEVVVQLLDKFVEEGASTERAIFRIMNEIKGSYALAIIDREDENTVYAAKNKSPLLIGIGDEFNMLASDAMAMIKYTNRFYELEDKEFIKIRKNKVEIYDLQGNQKFRKELKVDMDAADIELGVHKHYMIKEIKEQACVMRRIIEKYSDVDRNISIDEKLINDVNEADKLYIIACGTSYHAGLVGKNLLEKISRKPVEVLIASEFVYNEALLTDHPMFVFISQSGETADCRAALVKAKNRNFKTLTITNTENSTLDRESNYSLYLYAGMEIAVASTKAYTAQIAVLSILATRLARFNANENNNEINNKVTNEVNIEINNKNENNSKKTNTYAQIDIFKELSIVAKVMEDLCEQENKFKIMATEFLYKEKSCFYIGRGVDYYTCLEAALKLKEISYIQTEGFAAGELKHGPIALIEENIPVIAIISQKNICANTRSNIKEVKARGARVGVISCDDVSLNGDDIVIENVNELLAPLVTTIPTQFIAYYAALNNGYDIDKPRNLAKSVTVE